MRREMLGKQARQTQKLVKQDETTARIAQEAQEKAAAEQRFEQFVAELIKKLPGQIMEASRMGKSHVFLSTEHRYWQGSPARAKLAKWLKKEGLTLEEEAVDSRLANTGVASGEDSWGLTISW